MRHELAQLHKQLNTTTLYVTHDQTEALTLGQRVIVLNHGVLQQVATPTELYQRPANPFVANFIGQMNLWPVLYHNGQLYLAPSLNTQQAATLEGALPLVWPASQPLPSLPSDTPLLMGFRPEVAEIAPLSQGDAAPMAHALQAGLPPNAPFSTLRRELLGAEQLLYLTHPVLDLVTTTVRCPAHGTLAELPAQSPCQLGIPASQLHWFDTQTQTRLF